MSAGIRELRENTGTSQRMFSEYFDIPLRTVHDWEQGRRNPPAYIPEMIEKIIRYCRASDYYHWRCVSYVRLFSEKVKNSDR